MATTSFTLPSNPINGRSFQTSTPPHIRRPLRVSAGYATAERTGMSGQYSQTASFYEVLGVRTGATCQEVKSAYRSLARVLHPDVVGGGGGAADDFMRVHAAYATLSDPEKRAAYDSSFLRRPRAAAIVSPGGGYAAAGRRGRTWETDQCW